ncbi:MAG: hypothetical protein JXP34_01915 [Planctomycetes bacterium]|nr:hypothetical protein [Planctomycetota bacterium]
MHEDLKRLKALSDLDAELLHLREALSLRPRREREAEDRLRERETAAAAREQEIKDRKLACDMAEREIREKEGKVSELQVKLNTCRSNEEYQILKAQIARLQEEIDADQERAIEDIGRLEALQAAREVRRAELEEVRREYERVRADVAKDTAETESRLREKEGRRAEILAGIEGENRALYERLLARYRSAVVVPVEDGMCQGCHMSVTPQMVSKLMLDRELVFCKTCQRVLFLDGDA